MSDNELWKETSRSLNLHRKAIYNTNVKKQSLNNEYRISLDVSDNDFTTLGVYCSNCKTVLFTKTIRDNRTNVISLSKKCPRCGK